MTNKKNTDYGYEQKGNRYFWKQEATTRFNAGFKSKQDCDNWINENRDRLLFDWRAGFMVKFRKLNLPMILVDRKGKEVKAF